MRYFIFFVALFSLQTTVLADYKKPLKPMLHDHLLKLKDYPNQIQAFQEEWFSRKAHSCKAQSRISKEKLIEYEQAINPCKNGEMKKNDSKRIIIPENSPDYKNMGENLFLTNLRQHITIPNTTFTQMLEMIKQDFIILFEPPATDSNSFFEIFPMLSKRVSYISLGTFPTPMQKLNILGQALGIPNLYIKRDDLSGKICEDGSRLFGGNKVRKLEFLFGQALKHNAKTILTFGGIGSNHAVATAAYAQQLGLKSIVMVKPQPNSFMVRKNLLLMKHYGADIHFCPDETTREMQTIEQFIENKQRYGDFPYFIPTGGSMPVGIIGFVNAIFELKKQIQTGQMPEPDCIYIPAGSWGSSVGLLLGIKAAQLKTKVMIVAVEPEEQLEEHKQVLFDLFNKTNKYLHNLDNTFPLFELTEKDFNINHAFTGNEYGEFIQEGYAAKKIFQEKENIKLDGTYTSKAVAAMLQDLKNLEDKNQVVLYWHTYCSTPFESIINDQAYHTLPSCLHHYFEEPVQALDR